MFIDSKWKILTELAKSSSSPTDLAKRTGTTVANISVQLKLLEALGFVDIEKLTNTRKGEARKLYSQKKQFCYLILSSYPTIGKKMIELDDETMPYFGAWLIKDQDASKVLIKLFCSNDRFMEIAQSIGYLGMKDNVIEIIVFCPEPENTQLAQTRFFQSGKSYEIKVHSHRSDDFIIGLEKKEEYFVNAMRKVFVLKDQGNIMSKMKKGEK